MSYCKDTDEGLRLFLYVQPGAKNSEIVGEHDGCVKVRLAAPPVEGKANKALLKFLAKTFFLKQNQLVIVRGELSRRKEVSIRLSEEEKIRLRNHIKDRLQCS